MGIDVAFRKVSESISEKDLLPASLITDNEKLEKYRKLTGKELIIFDEVQKLVNEFNIDANKLYFSSTGIGSYFYYSFPFIMEIHKMDATYLRFNKVSHLIEHNEQLTKDILEKKEYDMLFSIIPKVIKLEAFKKLYEEIPDSMKYTIFLSIYTQSEYNFDILSKEFIKGVITKRTTDQIELLESSLDNISDNDELLIYRGMQGKSTLPDKAMSWTLSYNVALFFATRFNAEGSIYSANVKKKDVLAYITSRNEEEILVFPETLYNVTDLNLIQTSDELAEMDELGYVDIYHYYVSKYLDSELFENPDGIHGILHAKRVLLHTLSLSKELKLPLEEQNVLALAALYHDIGRESDEEDEEHGNLSWEKIYEFSLLSKSEMLELSDEETNIIEFIVRNHCIDDKESLATLKSSYNFNDYEKVERLFKIFKDCDGLDRVRLNDLDVKYLRFEESKRRVVFAHELLRNIR